MNRVMKRIICGIVTIALVLSLIPNMGEVKEVKASSQANAIVDKALGEVGYTEGTNNYTKYGVAFGRPNADWCAIFIWWCAQQAGIPESVIRKNSWAGDMGTTRKTGNFGGPYYPVGQITPQIGDIVYYDGQEVNGSSGHVEIVISYNSSTNTINSVGGNTGGGNKVAKHTNVSLSKKGQFLTVIGFERPNYSGTATISNVQIKDISDLGYTIECDIENANEKDVRFPTWPSYVTNAGEIKWYGWDSLAITNNGNHYSFRLPIDDFDLYAGSYNTHIYVGNTQLAALNGIALSNYPIKETEYNGHKYKLFCFNVSWKDAKSFAEKVGGHLVTVSSKEENDVVKELASNTKYDAYWMGATDEASEGNFKWVTGESFAYMGPGGFDNAGGGENYLGIWNGNWNDFANDYCRSGKIGYIVEFEPEVTEVSGSFKGHEYIVYKDSLTATEARAKEGNGYHLATITSADENNFIINLTKKISKQPEGYWLGANDNIKEGVFKWETGEPFAYTDPWPAGQPDNNGGELGDENYFGIWSGGIWNDFPEAFKLGYVLEKDPPASTASGTLEDHEYKISAAYMTRTQAEQYQTDGWYLAAITSSEERDYVVGLINGLSEKNLNGYWLGGNDVETEGTFKWENGEEFSYAPWDGGYPTNLNTLGQEEDYLSILNNGNFNDVSGTYCLGYVLERNPESRIIKVDSINLTSNRNETNDAYEGDTFQLTAEVLPEEATDKTVSWSSSDADYAVVDDTGNVTVNSTLPNTIKTIIITATSSDGEVIAEYSFVVCPKSSCQHTWDTGNILSDSTCSKNGEMEYTCTKCGTTKIESIGLKQHTEVIDEAIPATCETEGKTEGSHCSVCGKVLTEQNVIPRLQAPEEDQNNSQDETQKAEQKTGQGDNQKTEQKISQDDNQKTGQKAGQDDNQKIEHKNSQDNSQKNDDKTGQNTERKTTLDEVQMSTPTADEQISVPTEELQNDNTVSYSNEWVNGVWYDENGNQTYSGTLSWKSNSVGWWVEDSTGWYPVSSWQKIDGEWYYFTSSGYMASGEYYNGYWFNSDGTMSNDYYLNWKSNSTGWWVEDKSGWWPSGSWLKINGGWYYFDSDGYMVTNKKIDGYWIGADGVCQ